MASPRWSLLRNQVDLEPGARSGPDASRRYLISSQKMPATAKYPNVNTIVRMYGIPNKYTTACVSRSQKKQVAQNAVIAFAFPVRWALSTSAANGANASTALR